MKRIVLALLLFAAPAALADILVPVRTIRAKEIIAPEDLAYQSTEAPGALSEPDEIVGQEARVALYAVRPTDIGPPALVDRNDIVPLIFQQGGLRIITEGRSLGRGAVGETVRAMNISSRTTVTGRILADGSIEVQ